MANDLSMAGLSLGESRHAPNAMGPGGRSAYIPPHLRRSNPTGMDGAGTPPPGPAPGPGPNPGLGGSTWGNP